MKKKLFTLLQWEMVGSIFVFITLVFVKILKDFEGLKYMDIALISTSTGVIFGIFIDSLGTMTINKILPRIVWNVKKRKKVEKFHKFSFEDYFNFCKPSYIKLKENESHEQMLFLNVITRSFFIISIWISIIICIIFSNDFKWFIIILPIIIGYKHWTMEVILQKIKFDIALKNQA